MFIASYGPYHIGNVIRGYHMGSGAWCLSMTYTAIMAVACEFGGVVMIPMVTHAIVEDACNMKKKNPLERRAIKVLYVVTFLYGLLWAIGVIATGQDGSFRGLYC